MEHNTYVNEQVWIRVLTFHNLSKSLTFNDINRKTEACHRPIPFLQILYCDHILPSLGMFTGMFNVSLSSENSTPFHESAVAETN